MRVSTGYCSSHHNKPRAEFNHEVTPKGKVEGGIWSHGIFR